MTLRASRTTSSPNRFTVTTTFKDDSVLQPTSPRSDASVHRPQPKHVRTRSALFRSSVKEESPPPPQQQSSPLSSSPPPTASAPQPLSEDTTDADAATAADSPQAGTSHKHKHKSSSSSRKSKSKSKLKVKEVPVTRARSNDVVLVPPTPVQEDTPLPS